jgi:hypothetical protein
MKRFPAHDEINGVGPAVTPIIKTNRQKLGLT